MSPVRNMSRRTFLKATGAAGGALLLGFRLGEAAEVAATDLFNPNAWLEITPDDVVTIVVPWTELGQGALTGLPMLLAEELECDWERVQVRMAHNDPRFGNMGTGGSQTIRTSYDSVRQAGATARVLLERAAARRWGVAPDQVAASNGVVRHGKNGRQATFGELVAIAAEMEAPADVPLKPRREHRLIGTDTPRKDIRDKVLGVTRFGLDQRFEGLVFATLLQCPVFGGKPVTFEDADARRVEGVRDVFAIDDGVVVVADHTWAAIKGQQALKVRWDEGPEAGLSSAAIHDQLVAAFEQDGQIMREDGDTERALEEAPRTFQAEYEVPYIAHAPLEPINCTARITDDGVEVFAPIQSTSWGAYVAAEAAGVSPDKVRVQPTFTGGGFGRRLMVEYVGQCVAIAKKVGLPVQLVRTREDSMAHGFYRPTSIHRLRAGLAADGSIKGWSHRIAAPSISGQLNPSRMADGRDQGAVMGAFDMQYEIDDQVINYIMSNTAVPIGWLRSVYNTQNALANECFLDEIAHEAGLDPVVLRLGHLPPGNRLRRTLVEARARMHWMKEARPDSGFGIACHACFDSFASTVAEVRVDGDRLRILKVFTCLDCGPVVHPPGVRAQIDGATTLALSNLLFEKITIERGRVQELNFDDYPLLRLEQMPEVECHLINGDDPIGGVGEPGYPPVGPAVLNAIFAATGRRIRKLPLLGEFQV